MNWSCHRCSRAMKVQVCSATEPEAPGVDAADDEDEENA